MEAKKNQNKDLRLQRNKFFLIGLVVSISLAITAFEWRSVKVKPIVRQPNPFETAALLIVPITTIDPPSTPKPIQKKESRMITTVDIEKIIEVANSIPVDKPSPIDFEPDPSSLIPTKLEPEPEDSEIFIFVEDVPKPVDGFKSFYEQLSKNLKYPAQAKRMGTEGKVFVEFIVNRDGQPSDLRIIRGIGAGCDEEAMRVLALMKWSPGKQRGKPVRVKMVMPINFQLNN